ncbi:hypothetical protein KEM09_01525 [Carboxylicivirga mesophila]|uniref:Lipoprotein n=1 Tax=Carboxylicivirga mesophila TaxID=1166478 RepID=A0ABS5K6C3_9BACT|nr:hypothetical protein [Carboxylicivirga mesophila]MBS2210061.1 hypothetical protein [Carboxylicivirga mesophila]
MKKLNLLPIVVLTVLIATSCSSYQFATLNSSLEQPFADGFIFENDTLQLHYSFEGLNCPLNINVYNKLDVPINIYWNQSSLIVNGATYPINPSVATFSTDYSETSTELYYSTYTNGTSSGTITNNDRSGFVPPKASLRLNDLNVCTKFLNTKNAAKAEKRNIVAANGLNYEVKAFDFNKASTPLFFRCFISYGDAQSGEKKYIDNEFWVTSVYQIVDSRLPARADQFYLKKSTGVSTVVGVAALTGLAIIAIDNYDPNEEALTN